jgi:Fic family protein
MSKRLLRELHSILMNGVRGGDAVPGEFRSSQNWIGTPGARLQEATYVPPPVPEMESALDAFERFLNDAPPYPFLVWLAIAHYQFEAIHPFRDGNGRIGRLLLVLLMCHHGVLREPLLYLSAYFEKRRSEYYQRLLRVSQHGEWEEWIRFFLSAVEQQSNDAVLRARKLNELREDLGKRVRSARASALEVATLDELFKYPAISVPTLAETLEVTYPSALRIVEKFVKKKVLHEATGRARNRIYYAPEVVAAIEA